MQNLLVHGVGCVQGPVLCALLPGESCPLPLFQGSLIEGVPGTLVPLQLNVS